MWKRIRAGLADFLLWASVVHYELGSWIQGRDELTALGVRQAPVRPGMLFESKDGNVVVHHPLPGEVIEPDALGAQVPTLKVKVAQYGLPIIVAKLTPDDAIRMAGVLGTWGQDQIADRAHPGRAVSMARGNR